MTVALLKSSAKSVIMKAAGKLRKEKYIMNDFIIESGILKKYQGNDTHVTLPEGIIAIAPNAFNFCKSMESI